MVKKVLRYTGWLLAMALTVSMLSPIAVRAEEWTDVTETEPVPAEQELLIEEADPEDMVQIVEPPEEVISGEASLAGQYNVEVYNSSGQRVEQLIKGSGVSWSEKVITVILGKVGCGNCESMLKTAVSLKKEGASLKILYVMSDYRGDHQTYLSEHRAQYPEAEFVEYHTDNNKAFWKVINQEGLSQGGSVYTPATVIIPNDANRYPTYAYSGYDSNYESVLRQACGMPAPVKVTGITIDQMNPTVAVGQTIQLTATVSPANASRKDVKWQSHDETIAKVNAATGQVTGVKEGRTYIFAIALDDPSVYSGCWVTVTAASNVDTTAVQGFVTRAYKEIMLRNPDQNGLDYWTNALATKRIGGAQMCAQFLSSQEFRNRKYTSDKIVEICYKAFFDRAADTNGKAYWKGLLDDGVSVTYIARGMANSTEFKNICAKYGIIQGDVALTQNRDRNPRVTAFVSRCYKESLGRNGEADGLNYWTGALLAKSVTTAKVAEQFVFSKEMTNKKLNNSDFIKMLYRLCMGRTFDQTGLNYWLGQMNKGMTRQQVFNSFVNSQEFRNIVKSYGL